ncbi:DNA helicase-2 / ATP-dependent DNA helicase PcrA [Propionibacterium cyclohexanicum]|uniref:DNA 3'-5' helicase n=1 Tax=Propionibacterium cyclohexanicum TaxID=64702 RepID=A0A1H9RDA9_9ACTN|nr:ATP-dependent DNA helicase [Propionibacterium cyclohexanicum]SER69999.1 DNA helicase-2 / ATP-dependent DNA helicase PcrA [Propionibacterium cyclohexanicum]
MSTPITTPGQLCELLDIPFSEEQLAAITAPMAPAVIVAGAGTGKTTVMAARVVWLVATGQVAPGQVLGLTFTRKAAGELSQRVDRALAELPGPATGNDDDDEGQLVMTYDAFAGRLVADHAPRIGIDPPERMLNDASRFRLAAQVVAQANGQWQSLSDLSVPGLINRVLGLDSALAQHLVEPEQVEHFTAGFLDQLDAAPRYRGKPYKRVAEAGETARMRRELLELVRAYRVEKRRIGAAEFADQMAWAAQIAGQLPEVCELMRSQYRVVLLDEYQDTSAAQTLMLAGLFSGPDAQHGRGHPVTAVGDPYQGIYGWRGAAASTMADFARTFADRDGQPARTYSLTLNRRSGQEILEAANAVAAHLVDDPAMPRTSSGRGPLRAAIGAPASRIEVAGFDTDEQELDWMADDIAARGAEGRWAEIAVLARRNATLPGLYQRLVDREVPVEIIGLGGLLRLEPIREIICVLRLLADDTDNAALVQLLSSRRWCVTPEDLSCLGRAARALASQQQRQGTHVDEVDILAHDAAGAGAGAGADVGVGMGVEPGRERLTDMGERISRPPVCLMDVLDNRAPGAAARIPGISPEGARRVRLFADQLRALRQLTGRPLRELVGAVVASLAIDAELEADAQLRAQDRRTQLSRFLDVVGAFTDLDGTARLDGFLAYLGAESELDDDMEQALASSADSVKLLTVHRAKGLEWSTVYLPGLVEGTFPATARGENWLTGAQLLPAPLRGDADSVPQLREVDNNGIAEFAERLRDASRFAEDRLAYVAITRAKSLLVVTSHVWRAGLSKPVQASEYYRQIAQRACVPGGLRHEPGPPAETNPLGQSPSALPWPEPVDTEHQELLDQAASVLSEEIHGTSDRAGHAAQAATLAELTADEAELVREWRAEATRLADMELSDRSAHNLVIPPSLSASALLDSRRDPRAFLQTLVRPMPRRTSVGAGVGTRFHEWLERRFQEQARPLAADLLEDDSLSGAVESGARDAEAEVRLNRLMDRFEHGPYAERVPIAVEVPFVLVLGAQQVRGRIDAVYRLDGDEGYDYQVVDWKTFEGASDPWQLALYRQAWADVTATAPERIDAVFCHVMSGTIERPAELAGIDELLALTTGLAALVGDGGRARGRD